MAQYDDEYDGATFGVYPGSGRRDDDEIRALIDSVRRQPALITPTQGQTPRRETLRMYPQATPRPMPTHWGDAKRMDPAPGYDPNATYGVMGNQRSYNGLRGGAGDLSQTPDLFNAQGAIPGVGPQPQAGAQPAPAQALPQTLARAGAQGHDESLAMAMRAIDRQTQAPDMTAAIEENLRRANAASGDIAGAGILQALGGQEFAPWSGQILQQAIKARSPQEVPGGWGTIHQGQFTPNEYKQREAEVERLTKTAALLEARANNADTLEQKEILAAQANEVRLEVARITGASKSDHVNLQREGTTPSGEVVSFNPRTGGRTVNGQPYNGPVMSQSALDKQAEAVQQSLGAIRALTSINDMVAKNPNAFGGVATLSSLTPQIIASRWQSAKLTPQEREVRALVMTQAAQVINDLYGAAVSAGEMGRAVTFVPTNLDDPVTVAVKLKAAMSWANSKASTYGGGVRGVAEARSGAAPGAPGDGPPEGAVRLKRQ